MYFTVKESPNLDEFDESDKKAFDTILTEGIEWVEEGNRMWTINRVIN